MYVLFALPNHQLGVLRIFWHKVVLMNSQGITDRNARNGAEFNKHQDAFLESFKQGSHVGRSAFKHLWPQGRQ